VQNKPLVQRVVLVAIDGLGIALQSTYRAWLPFVVSTLGNPKVCCMEHDKAPYATSFERLVVVPWSRGARKTARLEEANGRPSQPPSFYMSSLDDMRALGYPVPVRPIFHVSCIFLFLECTFDCEFEVNHPV
jgi:hypothetical protein